MKKLIAFIKKYWKYLVGFIALIFTGVVIEDEEKNKVQKDHSKISELTGEQTIVNQNIQKEQSAEQPIKTDLQKQETEQKNLENQIKNVSTNGTDVDKATQFLNGLGK